LGRFEWLGRIHGEHLKTRDKIRGLDNQRTLTSLREVR
jgi:hypothetical protein